VAHYRDAIEQFIEYFESRVASIEAVKTPTYRKLLYATALDPLARAAFGNIGHRQRIVRLIDELTSWSAKSLISLPQLELNLREAKRGRYRLYREVKRRLSQWPPGHIIHTAGSPDPVVLATFATPQEHKMLTNCRYPELFYTYRNNLIHEFREPGYGIEMSTDKDQPYYTSMINGRWELVFPVSFFSVVYKQAVAGLRTYLLHHRIDPYIRFEFGSLRRAK
jgi:hypothetical protein